MKITDTDKKQQPNLWDAECETLIAMLAKRLKSIRGGDKIKICRDLNYTLLRKRDTGNKSNYTPTLLQRMILNETGY